MQVLIYFSTRTKHEGREGGREGCNMAGTEDNRVQLLSRKIMRWSEIMHCQSINIQSVCCRDGYM